MKRLVNSFGLLVAMVLVLSACAPTSVAGNEPFQITGAFDYTNSVITDYYTEQAVALVDMYGFVTRNQEWEIPVSSQTLGYLSLDASAKHGEYTLDLPERPTGTLVDVDNNRRVDTGVQVFAVSYWPNLYGGPYSEGDDASRGWPTYLASIRTDSENADEVIGGKLVVWAPDATESFPTGYGDDGKLFTADDPVAKLRAGWTIVDLDQSPFKFSKQSQPVLTLYEPKDAAIKDFSGMSYTDAFEAMFNFVKTNYAFNGIEGKAPDWTTLHNELQPRIAAAQSGSDANAFWLALRDFTWAFKDGHVGMSSSDYGNQLFTDSTAGGYGFALGELDSGKIVVIYVSSNGPAAVAGIQVGAEVSLFNGRPINEALSSVRPWALPISEESSLRYQQLRYLLRAAPGDHAALTFSNPGGQSQTVTLTAVSERDSFSRTSVYFNAPPDTYVPVDFSILDSSVGYVRINSNYDDLNLIIKLFERALKTFTSAGVAGIIIDMRYNSGGANLGLAGFLTNQEIPMGLLEYYSETTGKFEPEGVREVVRPNVEQYHFDHLAVLVGPACYSACELEAYGFSQVPGMEVVGMYPTAGTEAEVARGQILMPDGISMQFPTGRFLLPDGSLFLEGTGVQPTIRVPRTLETLSTSDDIVLQTAEQVVLGAYTGAPASPAAVSGGPRLLTSSELDAAISANTDQLEQRASESYSTEEMVKVPNTFTYTINLPRSTKLLWIWGWCAKDQATLDDNLSKMQLTFTLAGNIIPTTQFQKFDYDTSDGQKCTAYVAGITDWPSGQTQVVTALDFTAPLNDGTYDYPVGQQVFNYNVILP